MTRHVYFSFHYDQDIMRANVVRKTPEFRTTYNAKNKAFFDDSLWEKAKKQDDSSIKRMIDSGLRGTTIDHASDRVVSRDNPIPPSPPIECVSRQVTGPGPEADWPIPWAA